LVVQNRNGQDTTYHFLAYDEPTTAWPLSIQTPIATTSLIRDVWGKPKSMTRGSVTRTFDYNGNEQLWTVTDPELGTTTYTYDDAANVKTIDHNATATETRTYDTRNRLKGITYSNGDPSVAMSWRADGQPDTFSRGDNKRVYGYDGASLLTGETVTIGGSGYALGYAYDLNQHLKTLTYPDTSSVSYAPDAFGHPSQVGSYASSLTYFPNDAIKAFTFGNGITHSLTQDARLNPLTASDSGITHSTYGYDHDSNPTSIVDTVSSAYSRTLTYDTLDRLKTAAGPWGSSMLSYDTQDNLTADTSPPSTSISIGAGNQATSVTVGGTAMALTFDGRGNLKQKGSGTTATHYTFDDANLLTSIAKSGSTWEYSYDALGYRSTTASPTWNVVSVYDHTGRLLYETESANGVPDRIFQNGFELPAAATSQSKYVYLGAHLLAVERKTGSATQLAYQHTDALGTPVAQTDTSRHLLGTSTYLPYGGLNASTGIGNLTGPGYVNQYADDTGLIYMHARYYDPQLRRFLSADPNPVDDSTGLNFNRYAYASNSPFAKYDPSGRDSACFYADPPTCGGSMDEATSEVVDAVLPPLMTMQPEIGAGEAIGASAVEGIAEAVPVAIEEVEQLASAASEEIVRVGRWMSDVERDAMTATGRVQESSLGGVTSVSMPPDPAAWIRQTTAANYVEFDVSASAVRPLGSANAKIYGPNSIFGPALGITEMPAASNILQTVCRIPMNCIQ
jgi:RHS repeat-associated protein